MSKIYLLFNQAGIMHKKIGCVSSKETALKWQAMKPINVNPNSYNGFSELTLDDPGLLNRIAKESENKQNAT